jgi:hypothetical protein
MEVARSTYKTENRTRDPNIGGFLILKHVSKKHGVMTWTGFIWPMKEIAGGSCEHGI